jgi:hypothetical protein
MLPERSVLMSRTDEKYLSLLKERYREASKKERGTILDEFVKTTGYHRKYAIGLLNGRRQRSQGPIKRPRAAEYGPEEARALLSLSQLFDHINSKRLRSALMPSCRACTNRASCKSALNAT